MKKLRGFGVFLLVFSSFLPVDAQQNNCVKMINAEPERVLGIVQEVSLNQSMFDVIYQKLNFEVDPSVYYIEGEVSILYKALSALDTLVLDLSDFLIVDSVLQRNVKIDFIHQNNQILINIEDVPNFTIDSVTVFYQGEPSEENEAFFISVQDVFDNVPVLATRSEPYGSSDWWPCKDNVSDKIDSLDVNITCPLGNQAVSLGLIGSIDTVGNWVTYSWNHRYPVSPYLVAITVSAYEEYHSYIHYGENDSVLFLNYIYPLDMNSKKHHIDKTSSYFNVFDSLFIEYPFKNEKYGHVEFSDGGGMEHQTISSMGQFDFELISHELAHQWFGDYITCGSWEDLWLNEGFATYCTGLCYENLEGGYWWPIWKEISVAAITQFATGTVFPSDTLDRDRLFDSRLTYRKASYLLHMLRWTIGDIAFFQSINNYLKDDDLAYSFAKTPQLIAYIEEQTDTSLTQFMDDWFYGESYPVYDIKCSQNEENKFYVNIKQTSALDDGHFFKLFVPIRIVGENDSIDLRINHQYNNQSFSFPVNFRVDTVIFDPDRWLISKSPEVKIGINEFSDNELRIFPNPFTDKIIIESKTPINSIEITNLKGQVFEAELSNNILNLSTLKSGVYLLKVNSNKQQYIKKIIKKNL